MRDLAEGERGQRRSEGFQWTDQFRDMLTAFTSVVFHSCL